MYAIVTTGGKQYKVEKDCIIKVEKLDANVGDNIELEVLMVSDNGAVKVGKDIKKAVVKAEVLAQDKAKKNIRKRQGHRQPFTAIKITSIEA